MSNLLKLLLLGFVAMTLVACPGGEDPNPTAECTEGKLDCPCASGDQCEGELLCVIGTCRRPVCTQGDGGCACFPNLTCNKAGDGSDLLCDSGLCVTPACAQGTLGCGCFNGNVCEQGLFWSNASGIPR